MITIRTAQMAALRDSQAGQLLADMIAHVQREFAQDVAALGPELLKQHVRTVLDQAAAFGIATEREHARFLNLAVSLGWSFHTESAYTWVGEYLQDAQIAEMAVRVDRVVSRCIGQLKADEANANARRAFAGSAS